MAKRPSRHESTPAPPSEDVEREESAREESAREERPIPPLGPTTTAEAEPAVMSEPELATFETPEVLAAPGWTLTLTGPGNPPRDPNHLVENSARSLVRNLREAGHVVETAVLDANGESTSLIKTS